MLNLICFYHACKELIRLFLFAFCSHFTAISNIIKAFSNQTLSSGARRSAPTCWKGMYFIVHVCSLNIKKSYEISSLFRTSRSLHNKHNKPAELSCNLTLLQARHMCSSFHFLSSVASFFSDICKRSLPNYSDYAQKKLSAKTNHEVSIQPENLRTLICCRDT